MDGKRVPSAHIGAWLKQWWISWYKSESIGLSILSIIWKPGRYTENLWCNTPEIRCASWALLLWNCKSTRINLDMGKISGNTILHLLLWFIKNNKRTLCSSRQSWIFRAGLMNMSEIRYWHIPVNYCSFIRAFHHTHWDWNHLSQEIYPVKCWVSCERTVFHQSPGSRGALGWLICY